MRVVVREALSFLLRWIGATAFLMCAASALASAFSKGVLKYGESLGLLMQHVHGPYLFLAATLGLAVAYVTRNKA